jgi:hypothetical protein
MRILEEHMPGLMHEFRELLSTGGLDDPVETGSAFERLAVPHTFQPRMSLAAASFAALVALVRIFLGSMLFAVWGGCTWALWVVIPNPLWRYVTLVPVIAGLAVTMGLLMIGISVCARRLKAWWMPQSRKSYEQGG